MPQKQDGEQLDKAADNDPLTSSLHKHQCSYTIHEGEGPWGHTVGGASVVQLGEFRG